MKKLIILCLVIILTLAPNLAAVVMAQKLPEKSESLPSPPRLEVQRPSALPAAVPEVQVRRPPPAAGIITPKSGPTYFYSLYDFDHNNGLPFNRNISSSINANNNNPAETLTTFIAIGKEILSWAPPGLKIDSGLSYFLPMGRHFSAYASLKPSLRYLFTAPQTMVALGFHLPISPGTRGGHNVVLKFSTSVDQQFRPIVSFTLNLTPFRPLIQSHSSL